jgi:hypothetical protein
MIRTYKNILTGLLLCSLIFLAVPGLSCPREAEEEKNITLTLRDENGNDVGVELNVIEKKSGGTIIVEKPDAKKPDRVKRDERKLTDLKKSRDGQKVTGNCSVFFVKLTVTFTINCESEPPTVRITAVDSDGKIRKDDTYTLTHEDQNRLIDWINGLNIQILQAASVPVTQPVAETITPVKGATETEISKEIKFRFNMPMDPGSVARAITIEPHVEYAIAWSEDNTVVTLIPVHGLEYGTTYAVTIGTGAMSAEGLHLEKPFQLVFTTEEELPPEEEVYVTGIFPENGATGVPVDSDIWFTFSVPMDPVSTEGALVIDPAIHYEASWSEDGRRLTLYLAELLQAGTTYKIYIGDEARSGAGTYLGAVYGIVFETGE